MAYPSSGTLTTDTRGIAISETWDSQTEWSAYQSANGVVVENGTVMLEELVVPDTENLQAQYDFSQEDGTLPVIDRTGNGYDLDQGSYQGVTATINGVQAGEFLQSDYAGISTTDWTSLSQPNTIYAVCNFQSGDRIVGGDSNAGRNVIRGLDDTTGIYAGNFLDGGQASTMTLVTGRFDDGNSLLREDGTQTTSGGAGSLPMDSLALTSDIGSDGGEVDGGEVDVGEVLVYDASHGSTTITDVEQYLADKWGVTL